MKTHQRQTEAPHDVSPLDIMWLRTDPTSEAANSIGPLDEGAAVT